MTAPRSGALTRKLRAIARAKINAGNPCRRCGNPIIDVTDEASWHAGHVTDEALGGSHDPENIEPEHTNCNLSAGGKLGQAMKAADKATTSGYRPGFWFPARSAR